MFKLKVIAIIILFTIVSCKKENTAIESNQTNLDSTNYNKTDTTSINKTDSTNTQKTVYQGVVSDGKNDDGAITMILTQKSTENGSFEYQIDYGSKKVEKKGLFTSEDSPKFGQIYALKSSNTKEDTQYFQPLDISLTEIDKTKTNFSGLKLKAVLSSDSLNNRAEIIAKFKK